MKPRTLRNLLALTGEAERAITAAGRVPPAREYLLSALLPHARAVTKAARALRRAERQLAAAQSLARESADLAVRTAESLAASCIEHGEALPQFAEFDPAKFTVKLAAVTGGRTEAELAGELG